MLPSTYSYSEGLAATTIRLARTSFPGKQTNKQTKIKHRQREHEWDGNAQQRCIQNAKEYKQTHRGPDAMLLISSPARTNPVPQTDTQIRRGMTTVRQAMDDYPVALGPLSSDLAEWLQIWAKPLCKSTLKPSSQPQPPPHCQPLPITALGLTMPSIINIKPGEKQKRSDIVGNRSH